MIISSNNQEAFSLNTYFTKHNELSTITLGDIFGEILIAAALIIAFRIFLMKITWGIFYFGVALFEKM